MFALFFPVGVLLVASLLVLSSVSLHYLFFQLIFIALGVGMILVFRFVDWRSVLNHRWVIGGLYAVALILALAAYLVGPVIRNTKSWLVFGPFDFQPVELVKVALILVYASYFSKRHLSVARWRNIFTSFFLFAAPAAVIALQPDTGSAFILFSIWLGFLVLSGLPRRRLLAAALFFLIAGAVLWMYGLKGYQRARIVGVFYPEKNALSINYSTIQSKIAIGSGGFWGKGYKQGTQVHLGFLSEPQSDFALAAFVEEWGAVAGLGVILAFLFLELAILEIGASAEQNFEKFICLGTAMVFGVQFLLNAGSEVGLTPVIGVTFPFLSYGGSSLTMNFLLLALVSAIRETR